MKIRLLVLTLLIIGVHQHIQAQYMLGTTGMMNIPTADRQKPGTVMLGRKLSAQTDDACTIRLQHRKLLCEHLVSFPFWSLPIRVNFK